METFFKDQYDINCETMSLLTAKSTDYDSIVLESDRTLYVRQTPLQLIESACLRGGSSYDGRRIAVMHETGAQRKVPIPINRLENIYAFPTHSPKNFNCHWLFSAHIHKMTPNPKNKKQCLITFTNNEKITLDVSPSVIEKQMHRTSYCIWRFSQMLKRS
ncbi:competence protein ComK [Texcoconibacillus texcoconensis]|uniref:Competence protein ComK n=1 Tax=Texcoconibacillus texcoconensis TaxID=1095777 RepID=A0A840QSQ5_9BACI|nr:competence protein ComK [Texcoconibacillus texcoconensis]